MKPSESRSTLSNLLSKYVRELLKRKLSRYLENPDIETQGSLTRPEVTLKHIRLREDALDMYVLPVSVTRQSLVDTIKASFPLTAFGKESVVLELSNIRIYVVPNESNWTDFGRNKEKAKKLEEWKEEQKSEFRDMEKKGLFSALKQKVLNNMKQTIRNLELVYLDNTSMGYPCFVRIYVGRLQAETTNSAWEPKYSNDVRVTHRLITITEFSVALVADKHEVPFGEVTDMHDYYKRVSLSERHYILKPCNITIRHRLSHTDPLEEAWQTIHVESAGLELALSEVQFQYIKHLLNYINFKHSYKKYQSTRPSGSVQDNPRAWWNYLVSAAKHDIQANFKVLYDNKLRMERYIDLFKRDQDIIHSPWLQQLKGTEREELRALEEELPVNDLLFYRSVALNHLRIEAMQYVRAKGNVKGITHLGDLWDYYLNDFESLLGDPNQQVAREEEVEMNREEQQELKILMSMDKQGALKSLLSGKSSTAHDQTFLIDFSIRYLVFYLQKTCETEVEGQEIYQVKRCACELCRMKPMDRLQTIISRPGLLSRKLLHSTQRQVNFEDRKEEDSEDEHRKFVKTNTLYKEEDQDRSLDYVVEVQKITHDNPDPRLLGEHTLLVFNLEALEGSMAVLRNGRKWSDDGFRVGKVYMWDPISLRDPMTRKGFYAAYMLKNLLDDLIELNVNDDPAFYSLKHFMWRSGLLPCFEFYVHHKEITPDAKAPATRTVHRYCSCGHSYTREQLYTLAFKDTESAEYIHMSEEERPSSPVGMAAVAERIKQVFENKILPYFVRRCARWIFPSTLRRLATERNKQANREQRSGREAPKPHLHVEFELLGETNPIEVTFGQSPVHSVPRDDGRSRSHLHITLESLRSTLSNTTLSALLQWLGSEETETEVFAKESLLATFKERIGRMRPELLMVSELNKQAQKDVRHLYRYMQDLVKAYSELTTRLIITLFELQLLDEASLEQYLRPPLVMVRLENLEIIQRNREADNYDLQTDRPRHAMYKDLKFYRLSDLSIARIIVSCMEKSLLRTSVKLSLCECLVRHHPELPDTVLDVHIPAVEVYISQNALPLLSFINHLDFSMPDNSQDEEPAEQWSDVGYKSLFEVDRTRTKALMIKLNKQHYKGKQPCQHCQLFYTKYRKLLYFSIGSIKGQEGLSIGLVPDGHVKPSVTLKVPMLVLTYTERCFLQTASLLMSCVVVEGTIEETVQVKVSASQKSVFPVIPAKVYSQLPHLLRALGAQDSYEEDEAFDPHDLTLQEVLVLRQHVHPEVYTEGHWNFRESEYLRNKLQKAAGRKSVSGLQHSGPMNPSDSDIRYSDADYVYMRLEGVFVQTMKPLHDSALLAAVLGVQSLLDAGQLLGPPKAPQSFVHSRSKLYIIAKVAQVQLVCKHQEAELRLSCHDISFEKTPHNDDFSSAKSLETIMFNASSVELAAKLKSAATTEVASLAGSVLQLYGSIDTFKDHESGFFHLSNLVIADKSGKGEVVLLAAPSTIKRDVVERDEGQCMKAKYRQGEGQEPLEVTIQPVAVLLEAEMILGLQKFFERVAAFTKFVSPLRPLELLRAESLSPLLKSDSLPLIVRAESLQGVLVAQGFPFLIVELLGIQAEGEAGGVVGSIEDVGLKTKLLKYPDIVKKRDKTQALFTFTYSPSLNTLHMLSPGLSFVFLNRAIEDLVGYLRLVKGRSDDTGEKLRLELVFNEAELLLPAGSTGSDALILQFQTLKVENGTENVEVDTPAPFDPETERGAKQELDVPLTGQLSEYVCDLLRFTGHNSKASIHFHNQDQALKDIPEVSVSLLSTPSMPPELRDEWGLDTQVKVKVAKPLLVPRLSDFVHFIDILEANIDEKSELWHKMFKFENTQFDISIETGKIEVAKWINCPSALPPDPGVPVVLDSSKPVEVPHFPPPIMPVMQVDYSDSEPEDPMVPELSGNKDIADLLSALE